jgi:hypothetical protein
VVHVAGAQEDSLSCVEWLRRSVLPESVKASFVVIEGEMSIAVGIDESDSPWDIASAWGPRIFLLVHKNSNCRGLASGERVGQRYA